MLNKIQTYKFGEFKREIEKEDINIASRVLDHIKRNKRTYARLVLITTLMIHFNMRFSFAESIDASLDATFSQLIVLLKSFAKWGCLGMGLKKLVEEMLSGANFKQASTAGVQYWLCYLFIQFYPRLFDMIKL